MMLSENLPTLAEHCRENGAASAVSGEEEELDIITEVIKKMEVGLQMVHQGLPGLIDSSERMLLRGEGQRRRRKAIGRVSVAEAAIAKNYCELAERHGESEVIDSLLALKHALHDNYDKLLRDHRTCYLARRPRSEEEEFDRPIPLHILMTPPKVTYS